MVHRQHRDDQLRRARQRQRDHLLRPHPVGDQLVPEPGRGVHQLPVPEPAVRSVHGGGVRRAVRPSADDLRQRRHRGGGRALGGTQQRRGLLGRAHPDPVDGGVRVVGQRGQHRPQPRGDDRRVRRGDRPAPVTQPQVQPVAGQRDHAQRIRRGVPSADDPGAGGTQPVERVALEHRERVEQRGQAGDPVQLGEAEMLVLDQLGLLALQPAQALRDGLAAPQPHPDRDGVDEHPHCLGRARLVGGPPGRGGAEHRLGSPGEPGDQQTPRPLQDGVDGDPGGPRGGEHPALQLRIEFDVELVRIGRRARCGGRHQQRWLVEPVQRGGPGRDRRRMVAARPPGQPGEQIRVPGRAVAHRVGPGCVGPGCVGLGWAGLGWAGLGCVGLGWAVGSRGGPLQDLAQHGRHRPAVQREMVVGDHQARRVRAGDQRQPQQRRGRRIERAGPFEVGDGVRIGAAVHAQLGDGLAQHQLPRPPGAGPAERGAQRGPVRGHRGGGGGEPLRVGERRIEIDEPLHDVQVTGPPGAFGLEQQALLQRAAGQHRVQSRHGGGQLDALRSGRLGQRRSRDRLGQQRCRGRAGRRQRCRGSGRLRRREVG
ncbi:hypothetical protein PSA01_22320 [Pseudonocardia saturnea]|uniref:Uncharacterized protein n=1 Tax=Pseudonocardia saturnea TaxID=33909 RepID=A0ABQ0RX02_9PSEU|nr:hypothetical protein PSA01_22320 [Pseudonocardia saturnea]